jgi:hypothetical protein
MRHLDQPVPEDSRKPGADDQAEILGILEDLDLLEELLEDLDDAGITTRDEAMSLFADANKHVGERAADDHAVRLENIITAMDDFEVTSREDIVAKMSYIEAQADSIDEGAQDLEDL